jgi:hypothetical protein
MNWDEYTHGASEAFCELIQLWPDDDGEYRIRAKSAIMIRSCTIMLMGHPPGPEKNLHFIVDDLERWFALPWYRRVWGRLRGERPAGGVYLMGNIITRGKPCLT